MRKLSFLLALLTILLYSSCSRSVEGETSAWDANKKAVQEMKSLYPGFAAPLDGMMAQAQSAWDAAQGISDEEKKIEKMAEANAFLGSGWVGDLQAIDGKKRSLRSESSALANKAKDPIDRSSAASIGASANMTISRVENDLRMTAADAAGAAAIVRRATEDLRMAQKMVDDMESNLRKNNKTTAKPGDTKSVDAAPPAPTTWSCGHCGSSNAVAATECNSCGAPKK